MPLPNPHSGASSTAGVGAARAVSSPPNAPARYGTLSMAADVQAGTAECAPVGSAASIGSSGNDPRAEPVGATTVCAPNAKPGPRV